jgi:hypothetical protein
MTEYWELSRAEFIERHRLGFVHREGERNIAGVISDDGKTLWRLPEGSQRRGRLQVSPEEILGRIHKQVVMEAAVMIKRSRHPFAMPLERAWKGRCLPRQTVVDYPEFMELGCEE